MNTSGDQFPIYFGDCEIQELLYENYFSQFKSTFLESEWIKSYYADEADNAIFADLKNPEKNKYTLYQFTSDDFRKRLFNATVAKGTVGVGTIQYWIWSDILTLYSETLANSKIEIGGKVVLLRSIRQSIVNELKALYAEILQEGVISAIKHVENGSDGYKEFLLERLGNTPNTKNVTKLIVEMLPFMARNGNNDSLKDDVLSFLFYISALMSSGRLNYIEPVREMYSHYNGGKKLSAPLPEFIKGTPFYKIISEIDVWKEQYKEFFKQEEVAVVSSGEVDYLDF